MIIFLGLIIHDEYEQWFKENTKTILQESSRTHQLSIIESLKSCTEVYDINEISSCGLFGVRFKKAMVRGCKKDNHRTIDSCNIPFARLFYNEKKWIESIEEVINEHENIEAIVVYMPFYLRARVANRIKKKYPDIKMIVYVPDLVKHSYRKAGNIINVKMKQIIRYLQGKKVNALLSNIDGYVYLAEKMKEEIGIGKPYIIQEAVYNLKSTYTGKKNASDKFVITYCGKVSQDNGVDRLVNAFRKIQNDSWILNICGDGELKGFVDDAASVDTRIKSWGSISHDKVLKIEKDSDILVNPRYTYFENTWYSFPSKLIEYMACGRIVLSSKLGGIPREYNDFLQYIDDDSEEALQRALLRIYNYTDEQKSKIGEDNYKFVVENKSSHAQGLKLYSFIQNL